MRLDEFKGYADFYDALYSDKDYGEECNFLEDIFKTFGLKEVKSILDLGCGTGSHTIPLANRGYHVTGVDASMDMITIARLKAAEKKKQITFVQQNIQNLNLKMKFDAIASMFAVMSYQTTQKEFDSVLGSVSSHLYPGGLFIFDLWYGPAVLKIRPEKRVKIVNSNGKRIVRKVNPTLDIQNHTQRDDYDLYEYSGEKLIRTHKSSHLMRFFFDEELRDSLNKNDFEVLLMCPFMEPDKEIDETSWNISVVSRKKVEGTEAVQ